MINICGIQILNQQYDEALLSGRRACVLARMNNCFNPYLKYYAAVWTGIVLIQKQRWEEAVQHFTEAYNVIVPINENVLAISALSVNVQLCLQAGKYSDSIEIIDKILDILQTDKSLQVENEFVINLTRYQSYAYKVLLQPSPFGYKQLQERYEELSYRLLPQVNNKSLNLICRGVGVLVASALGGFIGGALNAHLAGGNIIIQTAVGIGNKLINLF